jgi:triosephosphate isomerase (TIM)
MKTKKKLIVGNWKMNVEILPDAKKLVSGVKRKTAKVRKVDVVFCPPNIYLQGIAGMMSGKWKLGMQNIHSEDAGSYTGEVSVKQVKQFDVSYIIVGHSERRKAGETDKDVNKKTLSILRANLFPIVCIGEEVHDEDGKYLDVVKKQLGTALADVEKAKISDVVVAYEPVWAIGAKEAMTPRDAHEMCLYIKRCLREMFGSYADSTQILYGGSVNAQNAKDIVEQSSMDGLLVGRDSLGVDSFSEIIKSVDTIK